MQSLIKGDNIKSLNENDESDDNMPRDKFENEQLDKFQQQNDFPGEDEKFTDADEDEMQIEE